ncbi:MAG TPA: outer membrane protein assembly factor BamA [Gammaproteobacteria bacterium]|nr:outer membrane protein assembly factor BamA [Gammaproteobacteria bacterium]
MKNRIILVILLLSVLFTKVCAADTFVVRKISIEGLQRISDETVYSYLPIKTGEVLRPEKTGAIISALYQTGFFDHISLAREGNTLIIKVVERPTIGQLKISGNSSIPTDKLTGVIRGVGVAEGRVYNEVILEKIKQSLLDQYYSVGRYNARVDVNVSQMSRNRVLVKIEISEGLIAKVRKINIIGNHVFSEGTLDKQLDLTTPGIVAFFTQTDRYSQEKLDSSLEKLRNYYMDRGYFKFTVKSAQAAITPDRKSIFLTIVVDEGEIYKVKGINVVGDTIVPREELIQKVNIKPGSTFSRQAVMDGQKAISDALGNKGYIFTVVSVQPKVDDAAREVFLTFTVKPGKRAYVRHIYFTDNSKTNDEALRREIQQMEGAPVSTGRLEESKHRLSLLPYIRNVDMSVEPVAGTDDNVDVNYKVKEENAAQATFSIGYSQLDHLILGAGLNQKNFLGTGETLGLNATSSRYQKYFGLNFIDPYYTPDGISRNINISASKTDPRAANLTRSYNSDQYAASVIYGIPLGQEQNIFNTLQLGYGYEQTLIRLSNSVSQQVQAFVHDNGRHYQQVDLIAGLSRDSRDKAIFPTIGAMQTISANLYLPVTHKSLKYYTLGYNGKWYHPITDKFIATARGDLGYGTAFSGSQDYPFFKNFYAGGIGSIRGYEGNTLGPKDSNTDPTGGNVLIDGSVGIIFPNYISDNLRTTLFVDGGNVYNTFNNRRYNGTGSGGPRYGMGIEADWLTPLGLIDLSFAKALNPKPGDDTKFFDFSLGANFG